MPDQLIRKCDARRAILRECPSAAHVIDYIKTVDAIPVVHAHLVERIVDHEIPSYTVFECSACFNRCDNWARYCSYCGARLDGDTEFVRITTTSGFSFGNQHNKNYEEKSKNINSKELQEIQW